MTIHKRGEGFKIMPGDSELVEFELDNANVVPHAWYKNLTFANGRPNSIAVTILSDIVYWYRPVWIRDEITGKTIGKRKKFESDKLQRSYRQYENLFGFTYKQARYAINFLEEKGIITTELRTIHTDRGVLSNVMYIGLNIEALKEIMVDHSGEDEEQQELPPVNEPSAIQGRPPAIQGRPPAIQGRPPAMQGRTYTEITTETTTNTHVRAKILADCNRIWGINLSLDSPYGKQLLQYLATRPPGETMDKFAEWWGKKHKPDDPPDVFKLKEYWETAHRFPGQSSADAQSSKGSTPDGF